MTDPDIQCVLAGAIATIRLNRPARKNAMTQMMWLALHDALRACDCDPAIKIIILTGGDGIFCAGADIDDFARLSGDAAWRAANQQAIAQTQLALARLSKPTIAAIAGPCVGGGCGLAIACDLRLASDDATFGITPAKLGLAYSLHDTKLLVDLVGPAQAKMMLFTARLMSAQEALRIGLVNEVHAATDLMAAADTLAALIAGNSQYTVRALKSLVRRILDGVHEDDEQSAALFNTAFDGADFQEGAAAFREKRKPHFIS
jgi:enoyl-CoA hydratase/carnithine racemase